MALLDTLRARLNKAGHERPNVGGLAAVHGLATAADAMFAVSLVGSLFFNVSINAARPRIVLYLVITMIPFAVLVPLIGPRVDRVRGGHVVVIVAACAGRAGLTLALAGDLKSALFFPEAFAVLVLAKTYSVSRSALVPRLADSDRLVAANAFLARVSLVGGAIGGSIGVAIAVAGGDGAPLYASAAIYALAATLASSVVRPRPSPRTRPVLAYRQLHDRELLLAVWAVSVLRGALGALSFLLAFALRREGASPVVYGLVITAGGLGALAATALGPRLRRRQSEAAMVGSALAIPAVACLAGGLTFVAPTAMIASFGMGAGAGLGRQGVDSIIQRTTSDAARARAFGGFEARFQIAWAIGALFPVVARGGPRISLLALAAVLAAAAVTYQAGQTAVVRFGPLALLRNVGDLVLEPASKPGVASQLLQTARELHAAGNHCQATLIACAAIDAASITQLSTERPTSERLAGLQYRAVQAPSDRDAQALAVEALGLATRVLE